MIVAAAVAWPFIGVVFVDARGLYLLTLRATTWIWKDRP